MRERMYHLDYDNQKPYSRLSIRTPNTSQLYLERMYAPLRNVEHRDGCRVPEGRPMFGRSKALLTQVIDVVGYGFQVTADT